MSDSFAPLWLMHFRPTPADKMDVIRVLSAAIAMIWLSFRAWQIYQKPLSDLTGLLGLEFPPTPTISLFEIRHDSLRLRLSLPENPAAVTKYELQINGSLLEPISRSGNELSISGLTPKTYYSIRAVVSSSSGTQAYSNFVRVQTLKVFPGEAGRRGTTNGEIHNTTASHGSILEGVTVRMVGPTKEPSTPTAPNMARELSGQGRKVSTVRRNSPTLQVAENVSPELSDGDQSDSSGDKLESHGTVEQLNDKLEKIRKEELQTQAQRLHDEQDFEVARAELLQSNEDLKHEIKAKEEGSAELKRDFQKLDRSSKDLLKEKRARESQLQQRKLQRKRMADEIVHWDREISDNRKKTRRLDEEKKRHREEINRKIVNTQAKAGEEHSTIVKLEEDVKSIGIKVKELEEINRGISGDDVDGDGHDRERLERETESQWNHKLTELRNKHAMVQRTHDQAHYTFTQAYNNLELWNRQVHAAGMTVPTPVVNDVDINGSKKPKNRRNRQRKSRSSTIASSQGGFSSADTKPPSTSPFDGHAPGFNGPFVAPNPYYTPGADKALDSHDLQATSSHSDMESLLNGAPLSPTAAGYLPAGLLGDDEIPGHSSGFSLAPIGTFPFPGGVFGSSMAGDPNMAQSPTSPQSSESRSTSRFSSPRTSAQNLPHFPNGGETFMPPDRRSTHSTNDSLGAIGETSDVNGSNTKKLSQIFHPSWRRQRSSGDSLPPLGSLKAGQSQSFPRNFQPQGKQDPIGTRARSGSSTTGGWKSGIVDSVGSLLSRGGAASGSSTDGNAPAAARNPPQTHSSRYGQFRSDSDPFDPMKLLGSLPSPRPSSISSYDHTLPRPSSESRPFGWNGSLDASYGGRRPPPFGSEWNARGNAWSSHSVSRRPSLHGPSGSSISLGPSSSDEQNSPSPPFPIGTPRVNSYPQTATLNPNAPAFSFPVVKNPFRVDAAKKAEKALEAEKKKEKKSRARERKEEREKEKKEEKEREKELSKELSSVPEDSSPPSHRRSRDSRSIHTETSESHDSLDRSVSGTPSDAGALTPNARDKSESFIQKLSRKSSSSKFGIGWKEKGGLFSKKAPDSPSLAGDFDEDTGSEGPAGRSIESATSSPNVGAGPGQGRKGWGLISRKKKGDRGETEKTSETGDEEEELVER